MIWKFEEGVSANQLNTYSSIKQRIYHVRYINKDGDLRRLISASLVFMDNGDDKDEIKKWAESPDETPYVRSLTFASSLSKVASIMDFRASEENDYDPSASIKTHETQFEEMVDGDDETNYLHRAYFEKYIRQSGIELCICSSRNDEEAVRRLGDMGIHITKDAPSETQEDMPGGENQE